MKIYFLRHAEAEDGANDAERELTAKGGEQSRLMGQLLAALGVEFDRAFTSPLVRARQTEEIVLAQLPGRKKTVIEETDHLLNEASDTSVAQWLAGLKKADAVLLVGHMPSLGLHLARLLGIRQAPAVSLPKGALAVIAWEPSSLAELKLFITPKQAGKLLRRAAP